MAAILEYTDLVTLDRTKEYLRLDDQGTLLDSELTLMINAACRYVEQYTNYRLKPQQLTRPLDEHGTVNIYDYPVDSVVDPANTDDYTVTNKGLYARFCLNFINDQQDTVTYDCGYTDTDDVEPLLVQAVLEQIRQWFYNAEGSLVIGEMNPNVKQMLDPIKRFVF